MRFRKEEDVNGSNVVLYSMYSGNNPVIEEKHEGSTLVETRFNIISGGVVLGQIRKVYGTSEEYEYFYLDNLGSRRVVLDASGSVLDRFSYSAYGEVTHVTGSNSSLASFTGKGYDATGLIYFNARYYDPATGRFITEDPSRDGVNWYGYCGNNPLNFVDPDGRYSNDPDNDDGGGGEGIDGSGRGYSGRTIEEAREDDRKQRDRENKDRTDSTDTYSIPAASNEKLPLSIKRASELLGLKYGASMFGAMKGTQKVPQNPKSVDCTELLAYGNDSGIYRS